MDTEKESLRKLLRELAKTGLVKVDTKWAVKYYNGKQLQSYFLDCVEQINEGDEEDLPMSVVNAYNKFVDKEYDSREQNYETGSRDTQPKQQQIKQPVVVMKTQRIDWVPRRKFCFDE
jgi:hypothetical protein